MISGNSSQRNTGSRFRCFILALCCLPALWLLSGCEESNDALGDESSTLADYVRSMSHLDVSDELIACAAGGQQGFLDDDGRPVSIIFYPIDGARDFRCFESASLTIDKDNLSNYIEAELDDAPLFNGYLHRFLRSGPDREIWVKVSYVSDQGLHISNAIRLKFTEKPTEYRPDLLTVQWNAPLQPRFAWTDGSIAENAIYFQVVSDEAENLLSGTYTYEPWFQFYDLGNVVLNIRVVEPAPALQPMRSYRFTLMGVSEDNWVNLVADAAFTTQ